MGRATRDVVVVGGGPAGLATAIAARLADLRVTVLEPRAGTGAIDKACGEGLMPDALATLARLGVELGGAGAAFTGIRYVSGSISAAADFPGGALGRGVARTELHAALYRRAEELEVEIVGERAEGLVAEGVVLASGTLAARFVVGADGLRSKVREWSGLEAGDPHDRERPGRRFGVRRHLALVPRETRVEVVFGERAEAYLTPLDEDRTGVAILWSGEAKGFDELVARRFPPALGARLAGASPLGRDLGAGPFDERARSAARGRVALVGDAAGYLDAITGEGLALAFREAEALGRALAADDLASYARASRQLRRVPETMTRLVLAMARRPALGRRAIGALARDPALFSRLLGILGARHAVSTAGVGAALRFGARLLAPPLSASAEPVAGSGAS